MIAKGYIFFFLPLILFPVRSAKNRSQLKQDGFKKESGYPYQNTNWSVSNLANSNFSVGPNTYDFNDNLLGPLSSFPSLPSLDFDAYTVTSDFSFPGFPRWPEGNDRENGSTTTDIERERLFFSNPTSNLNEGFDFSSTSLPSIEETSPLTTMNSEENLPPLLFTQKQKKKELTSFQNSRDPEEALFSDNLEVVNPPEPPKVFDSSLPTSSSIGLDKKKLPISFSSIDFIFQFPEKKKVIEKKLKMMEMRFRYQNIKIKCRFPGCQASFTKRAYLKRHQENIHEKIKDQSKKQFICGFPGCTRSYSFKEGLNRHKKREHQERYDCDIAGCDHFFTSSALLRKHKREVHPRPVYPCDQPGCGKLFTEKSNLNKHKNKHQNIKCRCKICGRLYADPSGLRQHHKTKHLGCRYYCDSPGCGKSYTSQGNLKRHKKRSHGKEKRDKKVVKARVVYRCNELNCDKSYNSKRDLKRHKESHEAPFYCKFRGCDKSYSYLDSKKRHEKNCLFAPKTGPINLSFSSL